MKEKGRTHANAQRSEIWIAARWERDRKGRPSDTNSTTPQTLQAKQKNIENVFLTVQTAEVCAQNLSRWKWEIKDEQKYRGNWLRRN